MNSFPCPRIELPEPVLGVGLGSKIDAKKPNNDPKLPGPHKFGISYGPCVLVSISKRHLTDSGGSPPGIGSTIEKIIHPCRSLAEVQGSNTAEIDERGRPSRVQGELHSDAPVAAREIYFMEESNLAILWQCGILFFQVFG